MIGTAMDVLRCLLLPLLFGRGVWRGSAERPPEARCWQRTRRCWQLLPAASKGCWTWTGRAGGLDRGRHAWEPCCPRRAAGLALTRRSRLREEAVAVGMTGLGTTQVDTVDLAADACRGGHPVSLQAAGPERSARSTTAPSCWTGRERGSRGAAMPC